MTTDASCGSVTGDSHIHVLKGSSRVWALTCWIAACNSALFGSDAAAQPKAWIEFMDGNRGIYDTEKNPKAKGVKLSFEFPASWVGAAGNRPNTLYQVTSERGRGLELCNLLIGNLGRPGSAKVTEREVADLFDPAKLGAFTPQGARFVAGARTTVDGQPAAWVQYVHAMDRAGLAIKTMWIAYPIYYDERLIVFSCAVGRSGDSPDDELERRYKAYLPLFQQMANSLVIHSKWERR